MADNFYKNLLLKIINDEKTFLIFFNNGYCCKLLNILEITYPKDGTYYIYLAENLVQNFQKLGEIDVISIGKKIHTPQVGVVFLLSIFYFVTKNFTYIFFYFFYYFFILFLNKSSIQKLSDIF